MDLLKTIPARVRQKIQERISRELFIKEYTPHYFSGVSNPNRQPSDTELKAMCGGKIVTLSDLRRFPGGFKNEEIAE